MDILFQTLGKIAGIAGISIGLILIIFREVVRKNIFPNLTKEQSYKTIRLIVILTFFIALLGLTFWFVPQIISPIKKVKVINGSDTLSIDANTNPEELSFVYGSSNETLKMTDAFYDDKKEIFDLKVQNNSNNTIYITKIRLSIFYEYYDGASAEPSGTENFEINTSEVNSKYEHQELFNYDKFNRVSYKVPPHDVDRYLIKYKLDKSKLYEPKAEYGGEYRVVFTFFYDNNQMLSFDGAIRNGQYYFQDFEIK